MEGETVITVCARTGDLSPGIRIVVLSGRLDVEALERDYPAIREELDQSDAGIILDLGDVEFVASSGLRMLLMAYRDAREAGKYIAFTRPRPSVYKIFKVAGLDQSLPFHEEAASSVGDLVSASAEEDI
jgi:anti-sigma B factor antagonist